MKAAPVKVVVISLPQSEPRPDLEDAELNIEACWNSLLTPESLRSLQPQKISHPENLLFG
jgi:hypothetical protein